MKRTWPIVGVADVTRSSAWYMKLLDAQNNHPGAIIFDQILDKDGTVLLCLHRWGPSGPGGDHNHPSLSNPATERRCIPVGGDVTPAPDLHRAPSNADLERRDQPVTDEHVRILQRANDILASPAVWNRHDTRICKPADKTWSLFCALEKASLEVLGEYRHREVALQEVRFAVEDATRGFEFEHRLMDYNNLPSTRFEDIKHVLKVATDRVSARLAAQRRQK